MRREGETRLRRQQEITKEVSGWKYRLETAGKRISELEERKVNSEAELKEATSAPEEIAAKREELSKAIAKAQERLKAASDALALAETTLRTAENTEREAERAASTAREARARADAVSDAARIQVSTAADRIHEELETGPESL